MFNENGGGAGGVLTITNGGNSTALSFAGLYAAGSFDVTGNAAANTATVAFL